MKNIFGVVILYNPPDDFSQNLSTYTGFVEKLIIVDNSENPVEIPAKLKSNKIIVLQDAENRGISERLNTAAEIAISHGAEWLLTMDQDSWFSANNISAYFNCFKNFQKDKVAMFGVDYISNLYSVVCNAVDSNLLITSGSLVNLKLFKEIGGFDENLFIDEVDNEYCFRAQRLGFRTIKFQNIFLEHSLGTAVAAKSFKNFKTTYRPLHSPVRIYYMTRNYFYLKNKYRYGFPEEMKLKAATLRNRIKNNLIYGKNRMALLKYILMAYRHYKQNKMGKLNG